MKNGSMAIKRLRGVTVCGNVIAGLCKTGTAEIQVESLIPETARFHSSFFDYPRNCFICIFEDASFDEVPEGQEIPLHYGPIVIRSTKAPITRPAAAESIV